MDDNYYDYEESESKGNNFLDNAIAADDESIAKDELGDWMERFMAEKEDEKILYHQSFYEAIEETILLYITCFILKIIRKTIKVVVFI